MREKRVFYNRSKYINKWILDQPGVKEESITDWLLYELSKRCPRVYYRTFSRKEESKNGSDWEWWFLVDDINDKDKVNAYRFLVQAKKLLSDRSNSSLLKYSNKKGNQIDLLTKSAQTVKAFPLYMCYSNTEPDKNQQVKNLKHINKSMLNKNRDGCYLLSAYDMKMILDEATKLGTALKKEPNIRDRDVLNRSYNLSLLDLLFYDYSIADKVLSDFITDENNGKHSLKDAPPYLVYLIDQHGGFTDGFEREFKNQITGVVGLAIIDLREESIVNI